ncbi:MAG: response regulator [Candidatus Roizmanbacteria bacterium]|nr:MAG: response regulator [Candidatus Roizmanbacteria bacterium]
METNIGKHILIIDDDLGISEVIKIILQDGGYKTTVINNGFNIVKIVKKLKPDLILLDVWMSGIDGRDVAVLLRSEKKTSKIPIILISALSNTEEIAKEINADGFLSKPFDISELMAIVKQSLLF